VPPDAATLRILVVDDDEQFGRLLASVVGDSGYGRATWVATGAAALTAAHDADLILLDQQLPDTTGLDLLPALRTLPTQPSVILVTGHGDEALAVRALREGADDYLIKDSSLTSLLPQVIERVRRHRALKEALAAAERDLVHAERLAAIGQVNVTLHHTINNPLMAALAETDLLRASELNLEQRTSVDAIRDALGRIGDILQRLAALRDIRTTDYLEGVPMIDLSRRTQPMPVQLGEAVVWFPDADIVRVVRMLLTHAGFSAERVDTLEELQARAGRDAVRVVVVMGGTAPGTDPLGGFQPAATRRYTLVALVPGDGARARAAGADHVVTLPFDPGTFVSDLLGAMRS
jgi:DNA-binding response OmpR family regulator